MFCFFKLRLLSCILGCFGSILMLGQTHTLHIKCIDKDSISVANELLGINTSYLSSKLCKNALPEIVQRFRNNGYLSASIDSINNNDTLNTNIWLYLGVKYATLSISKGNLSIANWKTLPGNINDTLVQLSWKQWEKAQEKILQNAENNGYPFAKINLQNLQYLNNTITATANFLPNNKFYFDSLQIFGNVKVSKKFFQKNLNIKDKQIYNESTVQKIEGKLKELPFVQVTHAPIIKFIDNKAITQLFLKKQTASKFDFLLGITPKTSSLANSNKYELTGEGLLYLLNTLGSAELFEIVFKSYPAKSKTLVLHVKYPYLPFIPFGIDANFELFTQDSTYRTISMEAGLPYLITGNNYIKLFIKQKNTDLLNIDSLKIYITKQLPATLDVKTQFYGAAYYLEKFDYRFNPRKGGHNYLQFAVGNRKIQKNSKIIAIGNTIDKNFNAHYDSLNANNLQINLKYEISKYFAIAKHSTLKTQLTGGYTPAKNTLINDWFKIGGNKLLRGFDEQTILSPQYHVFTLEYRYLFGLNANLFSFLDAGYVQLVNQTKSYDLPYSFGAGANFETKAGIFALSYALGSQQQNAIKIRNGKIHFGYINYF